MLKDIRKNYKKIKLFSFLFSILLVNKVQYSHSRKYLLNKINSFFSIYLHVVTHNYKVKA